MAERSTPRSDAAANWKNTGATAAATAGRTPAPVGDSALRKAAKALVAQWGTSGFYDRQDPALALALHEALDA